MRSHIADNDPTARVGGPAAEQYKGGLPSWTRFLPIAFFIFYLTGTVVVFAFGPWPWPVKNGPRLYTFLALAHLALFVGYWSAGCPSVKAHHGPWKPEALLKISIVSTIVLLVPTVWVRTGHLIPDVVTGLVNPGQAYKESLTWRETVNPTVEYIRILLGPALFLLPPLMAFYWLQMKRSMRIFGILGIAVTLMLYIAMGTNKGLADVWFITIWVVVAGYASGHYTFRWKHVPVGILLSAAYFALLMAFFTAGQISRPGSGAVAGAFTAQASPLVVQSKPVTGSSAPAVAPSAAPPATSGANQSQSGQAETKPAAPRATSLRADKTNWMVRYLPGKARTGAIALASYLTQGYYGLSLSMEKPFVPMYGVGNSMFLSRNAVHLTGHEDILKMPYPVRAEEDGWNATVQWSSIYPWIASDVSFPGTLVVLFVIGRLFAMAWLDILHGKNPFAVGVFASFVLMLFYFPANNQLLQSGEGFTSFYGLLVLWLLTRKRYGFVDALVRGLQRVGLAKWLLLLPADIPGGAETHSGEASARQMVFVGSIVPDDAAYRNQAFSRAGNMFQENFLDALHQAGMPMDLVLSQRPMSAYPRGAKRWLGPDRTVLADGTPVQFLPFVNLPLLRVLCVGVTTAFALMRWGWRVGPKIPKAVLTFNLTEPAGIFTLVGARLAGAKLFALVADVNVPGQTVPNSFKFRLDFWLQRFVIPRLDGLIAVNQGVVEDFGRGVPSLRIDAVVRPDLFLASTPPDRSRDGGTFTIVTAGTLYEVNGIEEVLQAFSLIPDPDVRLRIAGVGPLADTVKEAAGSDPRIEYCGYLSYEEVLTLYRNADLLISMRPTQRLNTRYFFPSKLMEYMASGTPVISTCVGHTEELFGEYLYLLRDESPQGLAQLIQEVAAVQTEERMERGRAARHFMLEQGTWHAQGRRIAAFVSTNLGAAMECGTVTRTGA